MTPLSVFRCSSFSLGSNIRNFSTTRPVRMKVAICGASGGIGQPLSLLLKQSPLIKELALHDLDHTKGVALDCSHINTQSKVIGYNGPSEIIDAFKNANIIIITAGVPRKPGMLRDDLFKFNADIGREVVKSAAETAPNALIAIVTNPVNALVPIAGEVLKKARVYDPNRLFGITTLDVVRSNTFVANLKGINPKEVSIPVIGGHSGHTIIPLFSQAKPSVSFSKAELENLTKHIQNAGTEIVEAKAGRGSATLSIAYATARFCFSLINGLQGKPNVVECSYVRSQVTEARYFATPLLLGKKGIEKNLGMGKLSNYEQELLKLALPDLKKHIQKGMDYIKKNGE